MFIGPAIGTPDLKPAGRHVPPRGQGEADPDAGGPLSGISAYMPVEKADGRVSEKPPNLSRHPTVPMPVLTVDALEIEIQEIEMIPVGSQVDVPVFLGLVVFEVSEPKSETMVPVSRPPLSLVQQAVMVRRVHPDTEEGHQVRSGTEGLVDHQAVELRVIPVSLKSLVIIKILAPPDREVQAGIQQSAGPQMGTGFGLERDEIVKRADIRA